MPLDHESSHWAAEEEVGADLSWLFDPSHPVGFWVV
jgi:hypothetical protein